MRLFSFAAALALTTAAVAAPPPLTPEGLGLVRIGMTFQQAERALGHKLALDGTNEPACYYASLAGASYMFESGRIVRIDIGAPAGAVHATAAGIHIGSTEADVKKAYAHVVVEGHPYAEHGHYLRVDTTPKKAGFIFETDGKRVTSFRAGIYPALDYSEGCS